MNEGIGDDFRYSCSYGAAQKDFGHYHCGRVGFICLFQMSLIVIYIFLRSLYIVYIKAISSFVVIICLDP